MCGISGIFAYRDLSREWPRERRQALLDMLAHRGPDDRGSYDSPGIYLAHTRLAILDLSVNARQPMVSHSGRYVLIYNGEIYNFREIRRVLEQEGVVFRSNSDTEVLTEAWNRWQAGCLEKLDGMFAFAVFDRTEKALYLVRDPFGIKPLFYSDVDGELRFASEPLPLVRAFNLKPTLVAEDLDTYFTFSYLAAPRTGISEIRQLPAGHLLKITCRGIQLSKYWSIQYSDSMAKKNNAENFEDLLKEAITRQLVSDVPLGVFLSGGLDSSAISLFASRVAPKLNSFTIGFENAAFDESGDASLLGEHLKIAIHIAQFKWTADEVLDVLRSLSELLADTSCYPIYQLARFAREKITVALSGDGGDELLAGYRTYRASQLMPYLRSVPSALRHAMLSCLRHVHPGMDRPYGWRMVSERLLLAADEGRHRDHVSFRRIFHPYLKKRIYSGEFLKMLNGFDPLDDFVHVAQEVPASCSYLTSLLHADLTYHLPSILAKVDRMSMAHGVEVRVPFLTPAIAQFCANIPDRDKMRGGQGKQPLRAALAGHVPSRIAQKKKTGFLPPVDKWFRESGGVMDEVFSGYLPADNKSDVLDWREVRKLWQEHKRFETDAGFVLLNLLHFLNWREKWGV